ncbi:MAG: hypothetical protein AAF456_18845 [Planctomycetota bacterium]
MSKKAILIGLVVFVVIVSWNSILLLIWQNPNGPGAENVAYAEPQLWQDIKKTSVENQDDSGFNPEFDESLTAVDGERVELPGVGFLLTSGVQENEQGEQEVVEFLLLPGEGGVAWCCGLTPIPKVEYSVVVQCSGDPFQLSRFDHGSSAVFVNVEGTFRLQKENSMNSLYTLEDVSIEFIDMEDVVPPNVMNQCLNEPMIQ